VRTDQESATFLFFKLKRSVNPAESLTSRLNNPACEQGGCRQSGVTNTPVLRTHALPAMDPFSALAVATSVVQFVDFGSKLVSRAIEIHTSPDDLPAELVDMAKLNDKMSAVSKELGNSMQTIPEKSLKPHEQDLLDMCQQCQEISLQLSAALGKVQKSTQPRTWDSLRAAFQSIMEQQKIQSLQSRLDAFRQQLMLHILIALR
jgi:hypothetical protein